ncbi:MULTISPECIES: hypothetical protein [unclassified Bartonella]|uniref:hypothetical protein n=1 Tax=unclassified Bartonella TaxID=2645622 RepID=UPI0035D09C61
MCEKEPRGICQGAVLVSRTALNVHSKDKRKGRVGALPLSQSKINTEGNIHEKRDKCNGR